MGWQLIYTLTAIVLFALPARAGDGDLRWLTIDTPHFQVHYPEPLAAVAYRTARLAEDAYVALTPLFLYVPHTRTQVLLTDFGDGANGSATALSYPRITLFAAPPGLDGNLGDYDDWLRLLVFHEFAHILQLSNTKGLPAFLNHFFGQVFAPNHTLPSFVLEGGAVWAESATSGRGRIRSAQFRAILRAQALAGRAFDIDAVVHSPEDWPGANVWYLYGGHFLDWVVQRHGDTTLGRIHGAFADEIIPFALNRATEESTGRTLTQLYRGWRADLLARSLAEAAAIEARGVTPHRFLTRSGFTHQSPRFEPDGALLALESSGRRVSGVYRRSLAAATEDGEGPSERVLEVNGTSRFALCSDGRLVFEQNEGYRGAYSHDDLYTFDPRTLERRRVTTGARLREADCAPDARWAAAVQMAGGRTRLVRVALASGEITVLHDPGGLDQIAFPTVSPDGRRVVAVRVSAQHGRDLIEVDVATGWITPLTRDDALELHPRFTADGAWLVYASDRDGVFNLYARATGTGAVHRLTRVVTGALDPAVDPTGRHLVFRMITADGHDLVVAPFEPGEPAPPPADAPFEALPTTDLRPLPARDYAPGDTVWPVAWSPSFSFSNAEDSASQLGLELEANDAAGHHFMLSSVSTTPEEDALAVSFNYGYRRLAPSFNLNAGHITRTSASGAFYGSQRNPFRERVTSVGGSMGFPMARDGVGASASVGYNLTAFSPAENPDPTHDPLDGATVIPVAERAGSFTLSLRFGDVDAYPRAISTESGRSFGVTARVRHPNLGGDFRTAELLYDYSEYVSLWARHVLALRVSGAVGRGDTRRRTFYSLSAPLERNVLLDALDEIAFGNGFLRGYPSGSEQGERFVLIKLAYRLPLVDIFGGPSMVPLFARRIKLELFTDWGQASDEPFDPAPSAFRRSAGAELLSEATLAWRLAINLRLGVAHGFDDDGETQVYFFLGRWF